MISSRIFQGLFTVRTNSLQLGIILTILANSLILTILTILLWMVANSESPVENDSLTHYSYGWKTIFSVLQESALIHSIILYQYCIIPYPFLRSSSIEILENSIHLHSPAPFISLHQKSEKLSSPATTEKDDDDDHPWLSVTGGGDPNAEDLGGDVRRRDRGRAPIFDGNISWYGGRFLGSTFYGVLIIIIWYYRSS